jgi:MtrB/PioB family decaheme-associated outer membrane protein
LLVGSNTSIPSSVSLAAGASAPAGGGTASLVYFPQPVDYDNERYEAMLAYSDTRLQSQFAYVYSKFTDHISSFQAQNPFNLSNSTANNGAAVPVSAISVYSTPPSNDSHQVKWTGGYNITPTTRLVANLGYTLSYQSDTLDPITLGQTGANATAAQVAASNGALQNSVKQFSGENKDFFGNVNFTARPLDKTDFTAKYTMDDRQNPQQILYAPSIQNDSFAATQWVAGNDRVHFSLPYSFRNQVAKTEIGYRLLPETRVDAGYSFTQTNRTFVGSNSTREHTFYSDIRYRIMEGLHGNLGYAHSVRSGSDYDPTAAFKALGFTTSFETAGFTPVFLANRERDEEKAGLSYDLSDDTILSLYGRHVTNNYNDLTYGRQRDDATEIGPDISFSPLENATAHLYYNYEVISYDITNVAAVNGSVPIWSQNTWNSVHTVGADITWKPADKLTLKGDYTLSYGNTSYAFSETLQNLAVTTANAVYNLQPVPSDRSILNSFHLMAEYALTERVSIWGGYTLELFSGSDYLYNQPAASASYPNALLPGTANPSYSISVIGTSVRIKL